jgi:hypothetical protein
MSQFTPEQRQAILAEACANLAGHVPAAQCREKTAARMSGSAIVYKTRVAKDDDGPGSRTAHEVRANDDSASVERTPCSRNVTAKDASKMPWTDWVDAYVEDRLDAYSRDVGQVIGTKARETREPLEEENRVLKREFELLRREFTILKHEVGLERGLRELRDEVAEARKQVPKFPAIASRLEAEQVRLQHELDATKKKLSNLRVDQSITNYNFGEMRKQMDASAGASVELEFESRSSHFQMKANHPDAARALKFAARIINGEVDGTIWLPGPAGTA